jgi:hypothetical protein
MRKLETLKKNNKLFLNNKASALIYVLVFGFIFLILLGGLLGFILFQLRSSEQKLAYNTSFHIAEAGINYYRWCLNNGLENCLTDKDYADPQGQVIGHFNIEAITGSMCGQTTKIQIISTGWTNKFPDIKRKIRVLYGKESIATFSYLLNNNVWIGSDHIIRGPYHSNGGIRFDGANQSTVSSAVNNWSCTSSFGCNYPSCPLGCTPQNSSCICPGVFTSTQVSNPGLFDFPVASFDFVGVTVDLVKIKQAAQAYGVYLPPSNTINSNARGYHLKFKNNGTFEVWIITGLSPTYAYSIEEDWHYDYFTITNEYYYNTYNIPPSCSAIFVEDNIWPEGIVKGKTTLASANLINPNLDTDVILQGSIDYSILDGSDGLLLIGERNILIGPNSPDQMKLRGIFVAQKGRFSRNHYPNNIRNSLNIFGSIISNGRVGTQWTSGSQIVSGYRNRESYFDSNLIYDAPVFTPSLVSDFKLIQWEEIK